MNVEDRIESAFADETFKTSIADVRRRRRPPLLRHNGLLVVALVVIVVAVAFAVVPGRGGEPASALDAHCRRQWASQPVPMPPYVFSLGGSDGIRVYAAGSTTFYCVPSAPGRVGTDPNTSVAQRGPLTPIPDVAAYARAGSNVVYAGTAPPGTDRVEFSGDGHVWPARLSGRHFVVAIPADIAFAYSPIVSTHGDYGIAVVSGPILHSYPPPIFGASACAAATSDLAGVPMLARYDPPASPTLKLRLVGKAPKGYEPDEVDLLAAPGIVSVCRDGDAVGYFEIPESDTFTAYGPVFEGGWAVGGRVPAGTTSVTVTLRDGLTVPASVGGGYWLAWDAPDQTAVNRPAPAPPLTAVAATPNGPVTVRITE